MKISPSALEKMAATISDANGKSVVENYNEAYSALSKMPQYANSSLLYCPKHKPIKRKVFKVPKSQFKCRFCGKKFWIPKTQNQKTPCCQKLKCYKLLNLIRSQKRSISKMLNEIDGTPGRRRKINL